MACTGQSWGRPRRRRPAGWPSGRGLFVSFAKGPPMRRFARPRMICFRLDRMHPAAGLARDGRRPARRDNPSARLTRHTRGAVRAAALHLCAWQGAASRGVARAANIFRGGPCVCRGGLRWACGVGDIRALGKLPASSGTGDVPCQRGGVPLPARLQQLEGPAIGRSGSMKAFGRQQGSRRSPRWPRQKEP